jgi:DNA-binding winged helix-turn-helix (wHTH) protein
LTISTIEDIITADDEPLGTVSYITFALSLLLAPSSALSLDRRRRCALSAVANKIVVLGELRAADGPRPATVGANDSLVPLVTILANPRDVEGTLRELALRIQSLLEGQPANPRGPARGAITVGELTIDQDAHRVTVSGEEIGLTGLEFKLLLALTERRERVYPRRALLGDVWASNVLNRTRTVDTHVKRLRDKLKSAGRFIQTVRSVGYRFSDSPSSTRPLKIGKSYTPPPAPCLPVLRRA